MITTGLFRGRTPRIPGRGVHLDLKGMPPSFPRLLQIVDICADLRVNFLLVEFEDMFPWTKHILRSKNAYKPAEIERFRLRCRRHGISSATFYKWKAKFGGLEISDARRLRALEEENVRLKRLLADAMLSNAILKDVAGKKW